MLSACVSTGSMNNKKTSSYQPAPVNDTAFKLSAGDMLRIKIFGDQDFTDDYEIDRTGYIVMPLIGQVYAADKTSQELQVYLQKRLSQGYLVNPRVSVEVTSFRPFYILGEVKNPGSYPYQPSLDVFKAIAIAGGLTPRAVDDEFIIMRGVGPTKRKFKATEDTIVMPGDSIKVEERFF